MREELELEKVEEKLKEMKEIEEVEENIYFPSHYSESGCPTVPLAFSGMTGRQLPPKSQQPTTSASLPTAFKINQQSEKIGRILGHNYVKSTYPS